MSTLTVQKEVEQTEMMTAPTLLKAEDINIYYGENHAVKNLNLAVHRNEILALIGPSGCGKSTFLRSINRMNDLIPSARVTGNMMYEEVNLLSDDVNVVALRKEIGMVFQKANPFPKSIYDNLTHAYGFTVCRKSSGKTLLRNLLQKLRYGMK
ncbi:phosphate transport ATP-binding protein PstB [Bacillus sp. JCM 19047]|nr:phosphate transport ATP-binding protein PstB [Bacillus sp. JCM 19047]